MRTTGFFIVLAFMAETATAADWPTYRHDMARSGHTREELVPPLRESWTIVPTSNDGVNYISIEGGKPAELIIEYQPEEKE